ncbi:MAG: hypothetical protein AB2745_07015 [Candidatus Thiodiazotropha endolucinida]
MIEQLLINSGLEYQPLAKKEAIAISQAWLEIFVKTAKEETGKYQVGENKWEAYWSKIEPSVDDVEGMEQYRKSEEEDFYVMDESGKNVFYCKAKEWPDFWNCGNDIYIMPVSKKWSMVFSHEGTCHYAKKEI